MIKTKGLSKSDVEERIRSGKVNYDTTTPSKSVKQILKENIFTLFNFINVFLGIAIIMVHSYKNLLFLGVVICNILISVIQEIRAKKIVDKLSVISSTKAKVIREGKEKDIHINEVVLDDIIVFEIGNQIITDSKIIEGEVEVNESFITGESKTITKKKGDIIISGSFIVSGKAYCKVIHVGLDNYTAIISKEAKLMKDEVASQIMRSLNKIVKYISIVLIPLGLLLLLKQFSIDGNTLENAVVTVVAAMVGMIPEGLILLVSTVLAISVIRLSKVNVLVQDLYAIETLARVDTLCLDKTGTITEGKMEVFDVVSLNNHKINELDIALEALSTNLDDKNPTFKAINEKYGNTSNLKAVKIVPFSSEKKYSGVIFKDYSYIIGAPSFVIEKDIKKYEKIIDEYSKDNRVLLLVKQDINKNKDVLGLVILKDKIRKEASKTIEYFKNNDVNIKVISGDNVNTVANVAKSVGIKIDGICDLSKIDANTNFNKLVMENNIFGRVRPGEKRLLIKAMKENGSCVAMTGDGVNDVLALKEADCAIAINTGSDAARNVSDLVLLDSNFDSIPKIVKEGRRTINNIERSATLFLSKTIYASMLVLIFLFIDQSYPFIPIQMTLINSLTIGIPAFILALESNHDRVKGKFFINVVSKAIPSGITTAVNILFLSVLTSLINLSPSQTSTIAVIITTYTALLLIYRISKPLNMLRKSLLITLTVIFILVFAIEILRKFYSLEIPSPNALLVLLPLMYVSTRLFKVLSNVLNIIIERKKKWFI